MRRWLTKGITLPLWLVIILHGYLLLSPGFFYAWGKDEGRAQLLAEKRTLRRAIEAGAVSPCPEGTETVLRVIVGDEDYRHGHPQGQTAFMQIRAMKACLWLRSIDGESILSCPERNLSVTEFATLLSAPSLTQISADGILSLCRVRAGEE